MQNFISILRGINVGSHNKIKMPELKSLYEELKCKDVITYIQSGNVICNIANNITDQQLSKKIEKKILEKFGYKVPVITRTVAEMEGVLLANPFIKQSGIDIEKLHVTFLADVPSQPAVDNIKKFDYPPDKFIIIDKEAYLYCPVNYGNTKLSNTFFENKLKATATTRNWRTVNALVKLATAKPI